MLSGNLRCTDYSQAVIRGRAEDADKANAQRTVRLRFFFNNSEQNYKDVSLPFLADHKTHLYGYDLKLLACNCYDHITGVEIAPARAGGLATQDGFAVESLRFVLRANGPRSVK